MSASASRTPNTSRKSIFFQDLPTPISSTRSRPKPQTPSSAPWRQTFSNSNLPPPPPAFTLEDRFDFSPEFVPVMDFSPSPEPRTPFRSLEVLTPKSKSGGEKKEGFETPIGGSSWWTVGVEREREREGEDKGKGSPVEGVVNSGALITLPPPREVARPEIKRSSVSPVGNLDEEEWVTVFG